VLVPLLNLGIPTISSSTARAKNASPPRGWTRSILESVRAWQRRPELRTVGEA
jgi:hypothetical protein